MVINILIFVLYFKLYFPGKDKTQHPAVINISNNTDTNETTSQLLSNVSDKNNFKEDINNRNQKESTKLINGLC